MKNKIIKFIKENKKWLILSACIFIFTIILEDVCDNEIISFDSRVYELISTLKNVFVVKNVMNIHGSINKVYSLQSEKVKTLITSQSKDTLNSLLHRDTSSKRIFSSIMNNSLPKTERMHSNKKVNINSSFTYYYDSNSKSSRKKELNTSAISTYHSKFSNCYLDSKLKDKLLCQSSLKKKNVLNLSISSVNNSQYIKTRNNSKSNIKIQKVQIPLRNKEYLNHKKRNYRRKI